LEFKVKILKTHKIAMVRFKITRTRQEWAAARRETRNAAEERWEAQLAAIHVRASERARLQAIQRAREIMERRRELEEVRREDEEVERDNEERRLRRQVEDLQHALRR
jgi:hypothetical protein